MTGRRFLRIALATVAVALFVTAGALWYFTRPHYAWLNFGPEARLRVLVCDRGLWITTTTIVDGKLSSPVERFRRWEDVDGLTLRDPDGQTVYTVSKLQRLTHGLPVQLMANVEIAGPLSYHQYCDLTVSGRDPESARVAHFHGPLTAGLVTFNWKLPGDLALVRGSEPTTLRVFVGTMDAARGGWVTVASHEADKQPKFPPDVRPEAEVVFPAQSVGQPPIVERFALDQVCCGCVFYAPVRVPDAAGDGLAKVTISFPSWTAAHVASSTVELPVIPAPAATATPAATPVSR